MGFSPQNSILHARALGAGTLTLSGLIFTSQFEAFFFDSLLARLFPLIPLLVRLALNTSFALSRRATLALACREGCANIRYLEGY
jgi:hypothetical protein